MPNIAAVLKEEIARVARKEIKKQMDVLKQDNAKLRKNLAELRKQITQLEKQNKQLAAGKVRQVKTATVQAKPAVEASGNVKGRPTGKMIKKLREKFGLSQAAFAALLGVTGQSIYQWERKDGALRLRESAAVALQNVRQMGKREVKAALDALGVDNTKTRKRKPAAKKAGKRGRKPKKVAAE